MRLRRTVVCAALLAALAGCGRAPVHVLADTGAKAAAQEFCDAVIARDWGRAHALLLPETRGQLPLDQFSRLAEAYRRSLGFEPQRVHLRSCEEQADGAVAHVVFMGGTSHNRQQYKDGFSLRNVEGGWLIVLPQNYGKR